MLQKLRILAAGMAVMFGLVNLVPAIALADTSKQTVCTTLGSDANCDNQSPGGSVSLGKVVTAVINVLSIVVGLVAVIMIIIGGFKLITSAGDSNKASSGRSTIIYAIIGLIIAALAQFIVNFVLNKIK